MGHGYRRNTVRLPYLGAYTWYEPWLAIGLSPEIPNPDLSSECYRPSETDTMKLLLVDDEQEICLLLNALLKRYGAETVIAHSLAEARGMFREGPFDGVFLDVNLPDGKGYELIPDIRTGSPVTRVIVISAMDQEKTHALDAGADLFLSKPLDRRTILTGLRSMQLLNSHDPIS